MASSKDPLHYIPYKANKVLHVVLTLLLVVTMRIWYLCVIQHEDKVEEAFYPRRKTLVQSADRGTIRDRFNIPLAINQVHYRLSISYSQLREIPLVANQVVEGKKTKIYPRREYIRKLAYVIAQELEEDADRMEDLIHAHAYSQDYIPFVIKSTLTERQYYRLRGLGKDFPGLLAERTSKRFYPYEKVACDILGYLGPISREKYSTIIQKIRILSECIQSKDRGDDIFDLPLGIKSWAEVRRHLRELEDRAYTLNDDVGQFGIEAALEEDLRGFYGKKSYFTDAKGSFLRQMHERTPPIPGKRALLTLSVELQKFAEELLASHEKSQEEKRSGHVIKDKEGLEPWIKGGAIVAVDPQSGEVLAMASHPRFNPNDFIRSKSSLHSGYSGNQILRWLENDSYLGSIWDQKKKMQREVYDRKIGAFIEEDLQLNWEVFLSFLAQPQSRLHHVLAPDKKLRLLCAIQKEFSELLHSSYSKDPWDLIQRIRQIGAADSDTHYALFSLVAHPEEMALDSAQVKNVHAFLHALENSEEQILGLDMTRLIASWEDFPEEAWSDLDAICIGEFRDVCACYAQLRDQVALMARAIFKKHHFSLWRQSNEKEFLKKCRAEEKKTKHYERPYLDYLDKEEESQFKQFWAQHHFHFMYQFLKGSSETTFVKEKTCVHFDDYFLLWHQELAQGAHSQIPWYSCYKKVAQFLARFPACRSETLIQSFKGYQDLNAPLWGSYKELKKNALLKDLAGSFRMVYSPGHTASFAFRRPVIQGSIFKLVVAYSVLKQRYALLKETASQESLSDVMTMTDRFFRISGKPYVGILSDGKLLPQFYKGGRIPKSLSNNIGEIDLYKAIENSSNPYFALLAAEVLKSPALLMQAAQEWGYGEKSGIELPGEISGKLPDDLEDNKSGLYAVSIGQHTLMVTPLQAAMALSSLCNGGQLFQPRIVKMLAGYDSPFMLKNRSQTSQDAVFPYQDSLRTVGINFPLFGGFEKFPTTHQITPFFPIIRRRLWMPDEVSSILMEGMRRVVHKIQSDRSGPIVKYMQEQPLEWKQFMALKGQFIGKSSTSEVFERLGFGVNHSKPLYSHIWFGGISFDIVQMGDMAHLALAKDAFSRPELVVIVFLRFSGYGKEAAPLAAQIVQKWRDIRQSHSCP